MEVGALNLNNLIFYPNFGCKQEMMKVTNSLAVKFKIRL